MIRQFILGPDDSHVAIVQFSNDASVVFDLHEDNQDQERVSDVSCSTYFTSTMFNILSYNGHNSYRSGLILGLFDVGQNLMLTCAWLVTKRIY